MKITETKITETGVLVRFDDGAHEPACWIEMQFSLDKLPNPYKTSEPLTDIEAKYIAEVRLSALRAARDVIGEEMQRIQKRADRID